MSATPAQPEPTDPDQTVEPAVDHAEAAPDAVTASTDDAPAAPDAPASRAVPGEPQVSIPAEGPLSDAQIAAIAATAQPATVRRAPRYKGFFWAGALVGIVLGVFFGLGLSYDGMVNRWIYVVVTVLGTTLVTVLLAGALAALVDKRGASKAAKQREASRER